MTAHVPPAVTTGSVMGSGEGSADPVHPVRYFVSDDVHEIGREEIRDFARAVQAVHPAHWGAPRSAEADAQMVAPPTFVAKLGIQAMQWLTRNVLSDYPVGAFLHTDQAIVYRRPVHIGDRLLVTLALSPMRSKAGGDILGFDGYVTDEQGVLRLSTHTVAVGRAGEIVPGLASAVTTGMGRYTHIAPATWSPTDSPVAAVHDPGPPERLPAEALPESGATLPHWESSLTLGDVVNYAGVAGDPSPIHWNQDIARIVGLDSVISHGFLTMGLGATYLTDLVGHPSCLEDYKVRFTGITAVDLTSPTPITFDARVKSRDDEAGTAVIALNATAGGRRIFGRATATVTTAV